MSRTAASLIAVAGDRWFPSLARAARTPRGALTAALGVLAIATVAGVLFSGGLAALLFTVVALAIVGALGYALAAPGDQRFVVSAVLLALLFRVAVASGLQLWLAANERTALFDDENGYLVLATELARRWQGLPPLNEGIAREYLSNLNVTNSYVHAAAAIFWSAGPVHMLIKLFNATSGVVVALLAYRIVSRLELPGARWALLLLLVFPSLLLWSIVGLKDSYAALLMVSAVWTAVEFGRSRRWPLFFATLIPLILMESVRRYLFFLLVLGWSVSLLIAGGRRGLLPTALASVLGALLLLASPAKSYLDLLAVPNFESVRRAMAENARTAFVEPPTRPPTPVATVTPQPTEAVVVALPPTTQVTPTPPPTPVATVTPQPTEAVVVALPPTSPRPALQETIKRLELAVESSIRHLPVGLAYLVGAPFPFAIRSLGDLALLPEMLLWYAMVAFAAYGGFLLVRERRWRELSYVLLMLVTLTGILSLVEGNVGTLVRHRAMILPFVAILAAVGFERYWRTRDGEAALARIRALLRR